MVKIEDKIGEWCGELKFFTEDKTEFCLKPRLKHKRKLMFLQKKFDDGTFEEKDVKTQDDTILELIGESYPDFAEEQKEQICQLYGTEILVELYCAWKWRDREAITLVKEQQKKKLKEFINEAES